MAFNPFLNNSHYVHFDFRILIDPFLLWLLRKRINFKLEFYIYFFVSITWTLLKIKIGIAQVDGSFTFDLEI